MRLHIHGLRSLSEVQLKLGPGLNVFLGANGAGKTSVLEAIHLLSSGRSFRSGAKEALLQRGAKRWLVFGETAEADSSSHRLSISRSTASSGLQVRVNERDGCGLSELATRLAVVCFEPGSHEVLSGGSEARRSLIDWGLFHVEPSFLSSWRRYQRALKQRNALLKTHATDAELDPWEVEMARSGESLSDSRKRYLDYLRPKLQQTASELLSELGANQILWNAGWSEGEIDLSEELMVKRDYDRLRGFTTRGPHRADWSIQFEHAPAREFRSRGQEKLAMLSILLAQAILYRELRGHWPVILLDDLSSELDQIHQERLLSRLLDTGAQVIVTGTEPSPSVSNRLSGATVFHVERGEIVKNMN